MNNSKKTAVVTGASSGIGAVYADRLAARGYDLVLVARRADRLALLAEKLSKTFGIKVRNLVADLENDTDIAKVEDVLRTDDSVKVLVNNAGLARLRTMAESSVDDSRVQITLNITALTRLTQAVLPAFISRNEGTIINVASVLALNAWAKSAVYSGTKAYVLLFSRAIQDELTEVKSKVRLQVVLPSATATEIWTEGVSGVPLSALGEDAVMSAENCVDAALAGLEKGEAVTLPSLEDDNLWATYDKARAALFAGSQTNKPASRYQKA